MGPSTTIRVEKATKKRIDEHGQKGETYDQILKRILDKYEKFKDVKEGKQ